MGICQVDLQLTVLIVGALACSSVPANAADYKAALVEAEDGNIECLWAGNRLITVISGPCENFIPPKRVMAGETFSANGKAKTIQLVVASRAEKDMASLGIKKGDWTCVAAESAADIPTLSRKNPHTGTWLYIGKCKPIE